MGPQLLDCFSSLLLPATCRKAGACAPPRTWGTKHLQASCHVQRPVWIHEALRIALRSPLEIQVYTHNQGWD